MQQKFAWYKMYPSFQGEEPSVCMKPNANYRSLILYVKIKEVLNFKAVYSRKRTVRWEESFPQTGILMVENPKS